MPPWGGQAGCLQVGGLPLCLDPRVDPWGWLVEGVLGAAGRDEPGGPGLWVGSGGVAFLSWRDGGGAPVLGVSPRVWPHGGPRGGACGSQPVGCLQGEQVWAYFGGQLQPGFPRRIADEFPGVPGGLDAAVECHPEDCGGETILFFKGDTVYAFDLVLRVTKPRTWPGLGPCDAALRWLERYYCLRGTNFQRFNPLTGEVHPGYPRDLRDYFIPCPGRGEGGGGLGSAGTVAVLG
uniref:Hemopexin n=1 Tax=Accipiter nisus TaxID=211598 RepID=A0A8B9N6Q9_9AVES